MYEKSIQLVDTGEHGGARFLGRSGLTFAMAYDRVKPVGIGVVNLANFVFLIIHIYGASYKAVHNRVFKG